MSIVNVANRFGILSEDNGERRPAIQTTSKPTPALVQQPKHQQPRQPAKAAVVTKESAETHKVAPKSEPHRGKSQRVAESEQDRKTTRQPERHETRRKRESGWGASATEAEIAPKEGEERVAAENPETAPVSNEPKLKSFNEYIAESGSTNGVHATRRTVKDDESKWGKAAEVVKRAEDLPERAPSVGIKHHVHVLQVSAYVDPEATRRPRESDTRPASRNGRFEDRNARGPQQTASTVRPRAQNVQFSEKDFPSL